MNIVLQRIFFVAFLCVSCFGNAFAQSTDLKTSANDALITANVKAHLAANSITKAGLISVETNNGVVKLMGIVDSKKEAVTAVQIAQSTSDVVDVDTSALDVKGDDSPSSQPVKDAYITAKVKGILIKEKIVTDSDIPALKIKVETKNGIVYLTGKIDNKSQCGNIEKAVSSISGVVKVVTNLKVAS